LFLLTKSTEMMNESLMNASRNDTEESDSMSQTETHLNEIHPNTSIFSFTNSSSHPTSDASNMAAHDHTRNDNAPVKRRSRVIKWDEETIAEHDKERGTRQRIDEPPTPYRYYSESETDQSEAESEYSIDNDMIDKITLTDSQVHEHSHTSSSSSTHSHPSSSSSTAAASATTATAFIPSHVSKDLRKHRNSPSMKKKKTISFSPVDTTTTTTPKQSQPAAVMSDWSELHAKLHYHQYLQGQSDDKVYDDASMAEPEAEALEEEGNGSRRSSSEPAGALRFNPAATSMEAEEAKATDFALRRAAHYNEYKVIQALRSRHSSQDENEDEDGDIHHDDEKMGEGEAF
jgi:hypothetical protein